VKTPFRVVSLRTLLQGDDDMRMHIPIHRNAPFPLTCSSHDSSK
jgi:hypothetical protein